MSKHLSRLSVPTIGSLFWVLALALFHSTGMADRVQAQGLRGGVRPDRGRVENLLMVGNGYPFLDDMEGDLHLWDLTATSWDTTSSWSFSPTHSWTDSPDTNYANSSDRKLVTSINLSAAQRPVLTFQSAYNIETDGDWGCVEVKEDESELWERVFAVSGSSSGWRQERIDLAPYVGNLNLKLRWRMKANSSGHNDGWYVDDVSMAESPGPTSAPPFFDNFNSPGHSDSLWLAGPWRMVPDGMG